MQSNCLSPTQFLNICSFNVRGLSGQAERTEMFNWLREKNFHVFLFVCLFVFVKEVHCTEETRDLWQNEWVTIFGCESSRYSVQKQVIAIAKCQRAKISPKSAPFNLFRNVMKYSK